MTPSSTLRHEALNLLTSALFQAQNACKPQKKALPVIRSLLAAARLIAYEPLITGHPLRHVREDVALKEVTEAALTLCREHTGVRLRAIITGRDFTVKCDRQRLQDGLAMVLEKLAPTVHYLRLNHGNRTLNLHWLPAKPLLGTVFLKKPLEKVLAKEGASDAFFALLGLDILKTCNVRAALKAGNLTLHF